MNNKLLILVINPGSTSTKIALYEDREEKLAQNIEHSAQDLAQYKTIIDQYPLRQDAVLQFLRETQLDLSKLSAVVGRGGLLPPVRSGAYIVNNDMVDLLKKSPIGEHASNLGAVLAYEIARPWGIPAYIYDSVAVDELAPVARITGLPEIRRRSLVHALNMRAAALKIAADTGISYYDSVFIVAHLGGGITLSVHDHGKMIDIVSDDEGPMSPERAGRLPGLQLIGLCDADNGDRKAITGKLRGKGGLTAHLQTNKALQVEKMILEGDRVAELVYYAMAYQVAKAIGELATVVYGRVDKIILTGGIAYSAMITDWIAERVKFIAPVEIVPGENEMQSLAWGVYRVLVGEEKAEVFAIPSKEE